MGVPFRLFQGKLQPGVLLDETLRRVMDVDLSRIL